MNVIKFKSIRTSLIFLVLLIFIPLLALVFHSALQYKLSIQQFASENALRVARNLAEQQKLIENNTLQFLEVLSQLPEIKSGDSTRINNLLGSLLRQNHSYASLLLVNTKGDIIAAGLPYVKINVSDRKYFQDVMRTKSFSIGEYARSRLTWKPVIHYAYPVMFKDGTIQSILIVSFDLKYYDEIFKESNLGDDASFTLMDHRGIILYQSANLINEIGLREKQKIINKINRQTTESTFLATGNDSIRRLYEIPGLENRRKGVQPRHRFVHFSWE